MKVGKKEIKVSPYNPRSMSKEAKQALMESMEEFHDISGIVINQTTGNIVSGNHRWEILVEQYGRDNLELSFISDDIAFINTIEEDDFTGFLARIVNWDIAKEKAANVTANNTLLHGEFTAELQSVLADLSDSFSPTIFQAIRLDELQIDLEGLDDLDWGDEALDSIEENAKKKNDELPDAKGDEASKVKDVLEVIKISVSPEIKDQVKDDLLEFLAKQDYYNEINIV